MERVGEGFVDFAAEGFGGGAEGAGEFGCCEGREEGWFEGGFEFCWELVDAFAVGGCEAVAEAEEGEELVAHASEHVFGLPGFVAGDGAADVEGVEPGHSD